MVSHSINSIIYVSKKSKCSFVIRVSEKKSWFYSTITQPLAMAVFPLGFVLSACLTLLVSWIWEHTRKPHQEDSCTSADSDTSMNLINVLKET